MNAVVLGYHNIGCIGIESLIKNGFNVSAVFTYHDNPDENCWFDSAADTAARNGIEVFYQLDAEKIRSLNPDIIFSFFYRDIVKKDILSIPKYGCMNLHTSLLPRYRGRCPVNWVLVNGEKKTGVTLHYMTEKADAGDIIAQKEVPIDYDDTALTLHRKCAASAKILLDSVLPDILAGNVHAVAQNHSEATYFHGRRPADGLIDWSKSAEDIRNLVRAVTHPYPGAFAYIDGKKMFIWKASVVECTDGMTPGTVLCRKPLVIACGKGALRVG